MKSLISIKPLEKSEKKKKKKNPLQQVANGGGDLKGQV